MLLCSAVVVGLKGVHDRYPKAAAMETGKRNTKDGGAFWHLIVGSDVDCDGREPSLSGCRKF